MGAMFAYEFQLIAKICSITLSATFREVWEDTMGYQGGLAVSMVNMLKPALGNLAYSMILADTFRSLVATFFGQDISRTISLVVITLVGICPLCLMKNLDALAPFSILGTAGILLTAACMAMRYFDGSYDMERDGRFLQDLPEDLQPLFGRGGGGGGEQRNGAWSRDVLVFVAMVFEAFVAHYNAPRFMTELKDASLTRFRVVVGNAFGFSSLVYVLMTAFGFLTFGGNCDGYILNNYSTNDHLATICRVAIAFSILFTYPITFMGFRDGILDILELPMEQQTSINMNIITIFLLIIITILAALFKDLGFINAVGGGTLATAIVFVFPALMYRAVIRAQVHPPTPGQRREVSFTMGLLVLGVIMGATGVVVELQQQ
jgi:amino acid permease